MRRGSIDKTTAGMSERSKPVDDAHRFEFGRNWKQFLHLVAEERIGLAQRSLQTMLGRERLDNLSFLDIGCGSGLFSLAARRLGATVHSFDYDPESVRCARVLRRRYVDGDQQWTIEEASVLDDSFMASLGRFDIVYAWGSLHHTGDLWGALERSAQHVSLTGALFVSIYPDLGIRSTIWRRIKRIYCSNWLGKLVVLSVFIPYFVLRAVVEDLCHARNPVRRYMDYAKENRGMSPFHDWIDCLGGYPYECARPSDVSRFMEDRGFVLQRRRDTEYLFAHRA